MPSSGFQELCWTQTPNEVFDRYAAELSHPELKILLYIIRKTFGWHRAKTSFTAPVQEMAESMKMSRSTANEALLSLEKLGLIVIVRHADEKGRPRASAYRLRIVGDPESTVAVDDSTDNVLSSRTTPRTVAVDDSSTVAQDDSKSKERDTAKEKTNIPPVVPPQPEPEEPETPVHADSPDLMLDDPVLTFTQNVYRQHRRAKLEKLQTRAAASLLAELENTERRLGPEAFRTALWRYLDTAGDEYLVRERWPLRYFLKHAERYEDDGAGPRHESPAPRQKQPLAAPERATATATPPPPPAPSCPDLRAEWQQHVPSAPPVAFWPERDLKNFERQWTDPVFREQWPALLARCEEFHAAQPGGDDLLSPSWVVKEKNWQRVLGNEFAWKLRKTSEARHGERNGAPRPGSLEAVVAEARRLRQEAKLKAKGEPNNASL